MGIETDRGYETIGREKTERIEADRARHAREQIIRKHGLTPDEVSRAGSMTPGDPVSDYAGRLDIQADMMVAERETPQPNPGFKERMRERFDRVAQQSAALACRVPRITM